MDRVHVSLAAADLLESQDPQLAENLVPRGKLVVKGKGEMEARQGLSYILLIADNYRFPSLFVSLCGCLLFVGR